MKQSFGDKAVGDQVRLCQDDHDFVAALRLIEAYVAMLGRDLLHQGYDFEIQNLAQHYGPPRSAFLLLERPGEVIGGVGVRPLEDPGICEMKRFYVYPQHRGGGAGRQLCAAILAQARHLGYTHMRLDTLPTMTAAIALYRAFGFKEIENYNQNPFPEAVFFECAL